MSRTNGIDITSILMCVIATINVALNPEPKYDDTICVRGWQNAL